MTDWNTFLQSTEFKAYRKKQIEQVGMHVEALSRQLIGGSVPADNIAAMNGAMHMARLFIDLPEKLTKDEGVIANLRTQKAEDMATLAQFLIRRKMANQ